MTVSTAYLPNKYLGDGIVNSFPITFPYQFATDIVATKIVVATQVTTALVLGTDYNITPTTNAPAGTGTLTLIAGALPGGTDIVIGAAPPLTQLTHWVPNDPNPSTANENAVDKLTLLLQALNYNYGRSIYLRPLDTDGSGAFDARGNRITNLGNPQVALDAINLSFMQQYINSLLNIGGQQAPLHYDFTGDGTTTAFTLTGSTPTFNSGYRVFYNGVYQRPSIDFSINGLVSPPILNMTTPPAIGFQNLSVDVIGFAVPLGGGLAGFDASVITTGVFNPARLGGGSATSASFLRGDNQWSNILIGVSGDALPPADVQTVLTVQQAANAGFRVFAGTGAQASIRLGSKDSGNPWDMQLLYDPTIAAMGWQHYGSPTLGLMYNNGDFLVGNTGLFYQRATNRVGIGNTAPAYTLDVSGTLRAANLIGNADASIIVSGVIAPQFLGSNPNLPGLFLRSDGVWATTPGGGSGSGTVTTTTATFTLVAVGASTSVTVASIAGLAVNQFIYISDGSAHTITAQITGLSVLTMTFTTTAINAGAVGNTMASGAAVGSSGISSNVFNTLQLPKTTSASSGVLFMGTTPMLRQVDGPSPATQQDTFIGGAGSYTSGGSSLVGIGIQALSAANGTGASQTVAIGAQALQLSATPSGTVAIGSQALAAIGTCGANTAVGAGALDNMTIGTFNTALGAFAGASHTSGNNNVFLGAGADLPTATGDGFLSIQNIIFGTGNNDTAGGISTGSIGIGIRAPTQKLDVNGSIKSAAALIGKALALTPNTSLGTVGASATIDFSTSSLWAITLTPSTLSTLAFTPPVNTGQICGIIVTMAAGATLALPGTVSGPAPVLPISGKFLLEYKWDSTNYVPVGSTTGSVPAGGTSAGFLRGDAAFSPYLLGPIGSIDPTHSTMSSQLVSLNDGTAQYAALTQTNAGSPIHTRYFGVDGQAFIGASLTPTTAGVIVDSSPPYESLYTLLSIRTAASMRANSGYWRRQQIFDPVTISTLAVSIIGGTHVICRNFSGNTTIQISDGTQVPTSGGNYSGELFVEVVSPGANAIVFSAAGAETITYLSGTYTAPAASGVTIYRFMRRQGISGWVCEQLNSSGGTYSNAQAQDAVGSISAATATITPVYTSHASFAYNVNAGSIGNTQLAAGILASKIASYPSDATKFLNGSGGWTVPAGGGGSSIQFQQAGSNVGAAGAFSIYNFLNGLTVTNAGSSVNIGPDANYLQNRIVYQLAGSTLNPSTQGVILNFASGFSATFGSGTVNLSVAGGGSFNPATSYSWTAPQTYNTRQNFNSNFTGLSGSTAAVYINPQPASFSFHPASAIDIVVNDTTNGGNIAAISAFKIATGIGSAVGVQNTLSLRGQTSSGFSIATTSYTETTNLQGGTADAIYFASNSPNSQFAASPDANGNLHTFTSGIQRAGEINYGNAWADLGYQDGIGAAKSVSGIWLIPDWLPLEMGGSAFKYPANFALVIGSTGGFGAGQGTNYVGVQIESDAITANGTAMNVHGGSVIGNTMGVGVNLQGYMKTGINFAGTTGGAAAGNAANLTSTGAAAITLADDQSIKFGSIWLRGHTGALQYSTDGTTWTAVTLP